MQAGQSKQDHHQQHHSYQEAEISTRQQPLQLEAMTEGDEITSTTFSTNGKEKSCSTTSVMTAERKHLSSALNGSGGGSDKRVCIAVSS